MDGNCLCALCSSTSMCNPMVFSNSWMFLPAFPIREGMESPETNTLILPGPWNSIFGFESNLYRCSSILSSAKCSIPVFCEPFSSTGIHFYTKLKTITSRWPKSIQEGPEFKMPVN